MAYLYKYLKNMKENCYIKTTDEKQTFGMHFLETLQLLYLTSGTQYY